MVILNILCHMMCKGACNEIVNGYYFCTVKREQILEESIQSIWKLNPLEIIILVPNDRSNLYEIAKET